MAVSGTEQMRSLDAIQEDWAGTFTADNKYPLNMEIRPVWEIVQNIDKEKGDALKEVLLAKWADETARYSPKYLLQGLEPACTDPAAENYNEIVLPGVPAEVTGCEDCCVYRGCTNPAAAEYVDRGPHTTKNDRRCTPKCSNDPGTTGPCRDRSGKYYNCATSERGHDMKCAAGEFPFPDIRYENYYWGAWTTYYQCCSCHTWGNGCQGPSCVGPNCP